MKVGFVGFGAMGRPMARNLREQGHDVTVYARSSASAAREDGHRVVGSAADVADGADAVILVLPDSPDVDAVLWGEGGLGARLESGQLLIDMSTISPASARETAERLGERGVRYLDAPVSGGVRGADSGTLTIMVGGAEADLAVARSLLEAMGSSITRLGDAGAGQVAKAANQMIVGGTIALVAEALAMVRDAGVDPSRAREALLGGFAGSRILENHGGRMLEGAFEPGFRSALQLKDLRIATRTAQLAGEGRTPITDVASGLFADLVEGGGGDLDHAGLYRLYDEGSRA